MNEPRPAEPWSTTRFLRWQEGEDALHELVGGFPLRAPNKTSGRRLVEGFSSVRAERSAVDAGGIGEHSRQSGWRKDLASRPREVLLGALKLPDDVTCRHDRLAVALIGWLGTALRGTRFTPSTRRFAMETRPGQIRRPVVGVDAGATSPEVWVASAPVAVFEIVTDPLRDFDRLRKIADYKRAPFLRHIVFCDEASPRAVHWSRLTGAGWDEAPVEGLDAVLPLTALDVTLPLRALYASAPV